eukprot:3704558-Pleurochrysis_carterae.AAC.1
MAVNSAKEPEQRSETEERCKNDERSDPKQRRRINRDNITKRPTRWRVTTHRRVAAVLHCNSGAKPYSPAWLARPPSGRC